MERHKAGGVVAVCGAQHRQRGVLLSRSFVDRLFADGSVGRTRIGYSDPDRLLTYPDVRYLSGCS